MNDLGVYDVVLPFLLCFTIVFAILEKTKVLGEEKVGKDEKVPRKNLNAMVAFTTAFFVIASAQLVEVLTQVSGQVVILLMLGVFFLMLVGSFYEKKEWEEGKLGWPRITFMIIMFVGIIVIFMNAIETDSGESWWDYSWNWLDANWSSPEIASIILIIGIIIFMMWVTKSEK